MRARCIESGIRWDSEPSAGPRPTRTATDRATADGAVDVDLPDGTVDRSSQVDGDDDEELIDDLGHGPTVVEMRIDPDVEALTGSSDLDGAALRLARRGQIHAAGADTGHCVDGLADASDLSRAEVSDSDLDVSSDVRK